MKIEALKQSLVFNRHCTYSHPDFSCFISFALPAGNNVQPVDVGKHFGYLATEIA